MKRVCDHHRHGQPDRIGEVMPRHFMELQEHRAHLHAGDQKDKTFEQIDHKVPEEDALQTRCPWNEQRAVPAYEQTGRDRRQNSGTTQLLRQQKRGIRRQQRQRDLDARIVGPAAQPQAQPADGDAISDLGDDDEREFTGGLLQ